MKRVTVLLGFTTAIFILLRFLEQYILARHFGPSRVLDAYFVAQIIILIGAQFAVAVTSAAVPILTSRIKDGNESLQTAAFTVLACVLLGCTALGLAIVPATPFLVELLGSGLDAQSSKLAQLLLRCSVPAALLYIIAAALRARWHVYQNLLTPGILQPLMPLISACTALLVAFNLLNIEWVPLGAALGASLYAVVLAEPFLFRVRSWTYIWSSAVAREFGSALFPVSLSMLLIPCMIAVGRLFASRLSPGNVSALSIAASFMSIPGQLAATSVGITVLPRASSLFSESEHVRVAALIERSLRVTIFCAMPFSLALALYPTSLIEMIFRGGSFNANAVALTANALLGYCIGIPALAAMQVLVFAFFASSAWRQVARVTIFGLLINLVLNVILSGSIFGISAAFSLSCCATVGILLIVLKLHIVNLSSSKLVSSAAKDLVASATAFVSVYLLRSYLLMRHVPLSFPLVLLFSFVGYIAFGAVLCKPEIQELVGVLYPSRDLSVAKTGDEPTLLPGAP